MRNTGAASWHTRPRRSSAPHVLWETELTKAAAVYGWEADQACRQVIVDAGYGNAFTHRTGHGLGMEAHEAPFMREGNKQKLEPGHVFTVEPGVYLRGVGGIRIEDDVLVTADGVESLTTFPRELQVIPV